MDFAITLTGFGRETKNVTGIERLCEKSDILSKITG